jgi:hypothetical protein
MKDNKLQHDFNYDSKHSVHRITVYQSSKPKIASEEGERFWQSPWEQCPPFNSDKENERFLLIQFFNKEMNEVLMNNLTNKEQIIKLISK